MLKDKPRQKAYREAIFSNKDLFSKKVVLDVGAGTGILSIWCAQAGARKVLAVEASNLSNLAKETVKENGLEDVVQVYNSMIEDFELPSGIEKVDIIISEWMGFYLLHEGMLDSVIFARDKFLKEDGLIFPDKAIIYLALCSVPSLFESFDELDGVKMSNFGKQLRLQKSKKPEVLVVPENDVLSKESAVSFLDLHDIQVEDLNEIEFKEVVVAKKPGKLQGVCVYFDVMFPTKDDDLQSETVVLRTSPESEPTHWKQTVILFPDHAVEEVEEKDPVAIHLIFKRNEANSRQYNLQMTLLDPTKVEHPLPCDCQLTKCILTKAHLEQMEVE